MPSYLDGGLGHCLLPVAGPLLLSLPRHAAGLPWFLFAQAVPLALRCPGTVVHWCVKFDGATLSLYFTALLHIALGSVPFLCMIRFPEFLPMIVPCVSGQQCESPDQSILVGRGLCHWADVRLSAGGSTGCADALAVNSQFTALTVKKHMPKLAHRQMHILYPPVQHMKEVEEEIEPLEECSTQEGQVDSKLG